MKNFLFVVRHLPHSGVATQEILDVILTTAAFDQAVSLLFLDDGVLQLKNRQQTAATGIKDTLAIFKVLELYDVQDLYLEAEALQERGLTTDDLALPVNLLLRSEINTLFKQFDMII